MTYSYSEHNLFKSSVYLKLFVLSIHLCRLDITYTQNEVCKPQLVLSSSPNDDATLLQGHAPAKVKPYTNQRSEWYMAVYLHGLVAESCSALSSSASQNLSAVFCRHSLHESVNLFSLELLRLISSFHLNILLPKSKHIKHFNFNSRQTRGKKHINKPL